MKRITTLLFVLIVFVASAQRTKDDFFSNAQIFFSTYVIKGKVNYEAVKKDSVFVNKLIDQVKSFKVSQSGKNEREAFYLNTYNILVIKSVADHYPIKSALDIKGFFDMQTHEVGGESVTLDELEKVIIANEYKDPRIRFWLIPAAVGSPGVNSNALTLHNINGLLEQQTVAALSNDDYIGIDKEHKEVLVPVIFKINEKDYSGNGKTVLDYINSYRKKKINYGYKVSYYFFNSDLNDFNKKSESGVKVIEKEPLVASAKVNAHGKDSIPPGPIEKINTDTVKTINRFDSIEDILSAGSYMLNTVFQLRAAGSLNTQHALYNGDMNRVDIDYRSSNFNFVVQGWNRISEHVNYGVQFTFRSLFISSYNSSPYDAISFSNSKNSKFYFRDVTNSVKFLIHDGKWRVTGITSLLVPGSKNNVVKYHKDSLFDFGQTQWINQLFFNRTFSKYFTLNTEFNGTYRFNVSNTSNSFILRGSLLPEFNYWFSPSVRFFAFCELNPQLNNGFFANFYFREGAGFTLVPGKISQWDFLYQYNALGKRAVATSSFMVAGRFNF